MKTKLLFFALFLALPFHSFAWGAEGHKMVATIAKKKLNAGVEAKVQQYLDTITFEKAAVWMDEIRSNHAYDYMKTWHYVNIEKGGSYVKSPTGDVVSELNRVIAELRKYKTMNAEEVKLDLLVLFHLCGDIVQPLHVGYGIDKGGNDVKFTLNGKQTSLHHIWDTDIIRDEKITLDDCLIVANKWSAAQTATITKIDAMTWMNDSRSFIPQVYNFKNGKLPSNYMKKNKSIVEKQIAKGGLRLAAVLNEIFAN
jgi:hypothetical protein